MLVVKGVNGTVTTYFPDWIVFRRCTVLLRFLANHHYHSFLDQFDFRIPDFEQDKQLQCYICTTNESDDCLDTDEAVLKKYIAPCVMPAGIAMQCIVAVNKNPSRAYTCKTGIPSRRSVSKLQRPWHVYHLSVCTKVSSVNICTWNSIQRLFAQLHVGQHSN